MSKISNTNNESGLKKLKRSSVILATVIAVIISAPIARATVVGMWIAVAAMIGYLAFNASFVSSHYSKWKSLKSDEKVRLIIWSTAAVITASTFLRHEFSFFSAIVILVIDYTMAMSTKSKREQDK